MSSQKTVSQGHFCQKSQSTGTTSHREQSCKMNKPSYVSSQCKPIAAKMDRDSETKRSHLFKLFEQSTRSQNAAIWARTHTNCCRWTSLPRLNWVSILVQVKAHAMKDEGTFQIEQHEHSKESTSSNRWYQIMLMKITTFQVTSTVLQNTYVVHFIVRKSTT